MLDAEILRLVDERVRMQLRRPQRAGTLVERTGDINGFVIEDGAVVAMPVLLAGDLVVYPGDRVVMAQFGVDWVVIGGLTPRPEEEVGWSYTFAGESVSGTLTPMPGMPVNTSRVLRKRTASSRVRAEYRGTNFTSLSARTAGVGLRLTNVDTGTLTDWFVCTYHFQNSLAYESWGKAAWIGGIARGDYYVDALWGNVTGGGTVNGDGNCEYSFTAREVQ